MDTPRYEAEGRIAEVLVAAAFVLAVGVVLWPPRNVYWTVVSETVGQTATLVTVAVLALVAGAWFARTAAFALTHLVVGALGAYLAGMAAIEVLLTPDSPAHLVWYAILLGSLLGGAVFWTVVERFVLES